MKNFLKSHGLFFLFLSFGIFFRFYNLDWGAPFYFHPDERQNIAYPVISSQSLFMLDQQNFDTGTFPLIVVKIIYSIIIFIKHIPIDQLKTVLLIGRSISAIISTTIIVVLFFAGKKIFGIHKSYISSTLAIFSVGFIEFSHFGTIELWEAIFFLGLFYFSWRIAKYARISDAIYLGLILGLSVSTKILSVILIPAIISSFLIFFYHSYRANQNILKTIKKIILVFFVFSLSAIFFFLLTSSSIITNFHAATNSLHFESDVALGKVQVFYTQSFYRTIPIVFQFLNVYPFLINPFITAVFVPCLIFVLYHGIVKKKFDYLLLCLFYLLLFVSQSFFFVKWTRYMIPTLPFIYIILGIAIDDWLIYLKKRFHHKDFFSFAFVTVPVIISFIFAASFFIMVYIQKPTPVQAFEFAKNSVPQYSSILSETFDPNSATFTGFYTNINFFDFYNLDNANHIIPDPRGQLASILSDVDYIILPSQRVLKTRLSNSKDFYNGNKFYSQLFNGKLGFSQIYETPCDIFCRIVYLGDPIFSYEETASVFDRPTVFIFKKNINYIESTYKNMLLN